ncbi:hypothetical protein H4R18_003210 [Coemansia javaensis]|uniref:Uncharacterized protein n=1 Tax=Coemansia javaensis TaxID=2761396 RepID=A0A9W8HG53_9FUNG|nr:hypothetical protein H4R18_003210 [Coemansia javaensis]
MNVSVNVGQQKAVLVAATYGGETFTETVAAGASFSQKDAERAGAAIVKKRRAARGAPVKGSIALKFSGFRYSGGSAVYYVIGLIVVYGNVSYTGTTKHESDLKTFQEARALLAKNVQSGANKTMTSCDINIDGRGNKVYVCTFE